MLRPRAADGDLSSYAPVGTRVVTRRDAVLVIHGVHVRLQHGKHGEVSAIQGKLTGCLPIHNLVERRTIEVDYWRDRRGHNNSGVDVPDLHLNRENRIFADLHQGMYFLWAKPFCCNRYRVIAGIHVRHIEQPGSGRH